MVSMPLAPPTILVVDDNPMVREVVQGMLNAAGFHALSAEDAATALALYASNPIDAAMIDVDMPGMNGIDLCRALQAQAAAVGRGVLAWLMTGVVRPELVVDAQAAGATGVLAKPFTRAELVACFEPLAAQQRQRMLAS